jgi:hypothetical protein
VLVSYKNVSSYNLLSAIIKGLTDVKVFQPLFYRLLDYLVFVLHLSFMLLDELLLDVVRHEFVAAELGSERCTTTSQ